MAALALAAAIAGWLALRTPARYFTAAEVDHVATPLRDVGLSFPGAPEGVEYYGTLRMDLYIDQRGRVDRVEVLESTLPDFLRDRAVRAFASTAFEPATRKGRPVKSVKKVEVRFEAPLRQLNRDGG